MVNVLQISRKCWRWALASSCAFPQNWLACTKLMSPGLSSKLQSMSTTGPVWMLSVVGAENSRNDLFAMTSNSEDKFRMKLRRSSWLDEALCWSVDDVFLSLALVFLIMLRGHQQNFLEDVFYSYITLHKIIKIEKYRGKTIWENW